ncbi:MAG TPA: type II secretion system F family protein [Povalibacter sp.]|jgi:MSHA biogenesis protein MshG|nr:type II secretion system F family protein [Povalibacter sp.]
MPVFAYTGRSRRGELSSGLMEGDSPDSIAGRLLGNGITPIDIRPAAQKQNQELTRLLRRLGIGAPGIADLVLFSRQMYTITRSGIPLLRGIRGLAASTANDVLREVLEDVLSSLEGGRDLAGSLARHPDIFPTLYISIIRVGEQTGTLEASFKRLAEYLAQEQDIKDRIKTAMRYPIIVLCTIAIAIAVLTVFVLPKFAPLFQALGDNIPMPTRILMGVSKFAQQYWYLVLGMLAVAWVAAKQYVSTPAGRMTWDKWKLKLPAIGPLLHEGILARVTRSLSISLNAGMPVIQTLKIIAQSSGNEYMAEHIVRMRDAVERGDPVSRAAASIGMFTPLVVQMMAVGEETGDLPALLDEVADFYEREVDYKLKTLSAAIEPILVIAVGAIVCVLALGVMLPMWEMIARVNAAAG